MTTNIIQYFVEGEDEKKLLKVLKTDLRVIQPGKVQKLNVVQEKISDAVLRTFKNKTVVVLVFDTDTDSIEILNQNIRKLESCSSVLRVVSIPQVRNLEDELIRSCDIKKITELTDSKSLADFKRDFIHISNLGNKLEEHSFDMKLFWNQTPVGVFKVIKNESEIIKINKE